MPKIIRAEESDGHVTATVKFPDGLEQSVILPDWATKQNIKDEAKRLRKEAEDREQAKIERTDLVE